MSTSTANTPHYVGHRARLRERFLEDPSKVAEYEVLELLLGYALTRKDTKPLAKELLSRFANIRGVLTARPDELQQVPGFGPGLMAFWQVIRECLARYAEAPLRQRTELASSTAVAEMARIRLAGCPHEECWMALVDAQTRCIGWERLRVGAIDNVSITPRDVLELALLRRAHGVILVHNHPGGRAEASPGDVYLTKELMRLAPQMGVKFRDHVIVTDDSHVSVLEKELI